MGSSRKCAYTTCKTLQYLMKIYGAKLKMSDIKLSCRQEANKYLKWNDKKYSIQKRELRKRKLMTETESIYWYAMYIFKCINIYIKYKWVKQSNEKWFQEKYKLMDIDAKIL